MPDEERLLIFYEDLINSPEEEIFKIVCFLKGECDLELLKQFCYDINSHKSRSLLHYNYPVNTNIDDVKKHSKTMSREQLTHIDDIVKSKYPFLWKKYLDRYAD